MVVLFRILLDLIIYGKVFTDSFIAHYPTFFYYLTFACLFYAIKMNRLHHRPVLMGILGIIIEISSSIAEITFQYIAFDAYTSLSGIYKIIVIAIFRSYFTIGFFNLLKLYNTKLTVKQTRQQNAHLLMIISSLYEETIHLKKTLKNSEKITQDSYFLYQKLMEFEEQKESLPIQCLAAKTLKIVGEIHEIKKDNQRIYAGLSKLISDESFSEYMTIYELLDLIIRANKNYALSLGKEIEFKQVIIGAHPDYHIFKILSILNNLVMNSIEAIKQLGVVKISVSKQNNWVHFQISDNGPGIPNKRKNLIFEPGFTSKFERDGSSSTGIGLSYVQRIVEELEGKILLKSEPEVDGTIFTIKLPVNYLVKEE
ncbi:ATP-binding protein [Bacillus sp. JJ1773]|uniref:ATP-binding protein n=1 Tax=Bacillus sp. JJ1773 TaxID=3122965 RepID=UPI002FFFDE98